MLKVYYDFYYSKEKDHRESNLFRRYFKYSRIELLQVVQPLFRRGWKPPIAEVAQLGIARLISRTRRLPSTLCSNARDADLLHLFIVLPAFLNLPWICECECVDQLASFFGYNAYARGFRNSISRMLEHRNFKKVIVNCQASLNAFIALDIPSDKIIVSYPSVQPLAKKIHTEKNAVKLLFNFGSNPLFFSKGGRELLSSFKALKARYPAIQLTIVGKDDQEKMELQDGMEYLGFVSHEHYINHILPDADILVHPTHMDSFGFVLLEAMAAGLPIVATKHYAIPEIIGHEKNGYLLDDYRDVWYESNYVPKPNYRSRYHAHDRTFGTHSESRLLTEQLTHYLNILIQDPGIRQRMGDANHEEIAKGRFSPSRLVKDLLSLYNQSLES